MHLLPCFHYISPTFSGQNFYIISISPKTITAHLYCQHHLKSNKFCHERYFLMYFVDVCGGENHLEKFWKCVIFSWKGLENHIQFSVRTLNIANFGPLTAEIGILVWGTPANFNGFCILPSLLQQRRSPEGNQTLHDAWPSPVLVHIFGGSCPWQNFARCKIHFKSKSCVRAIVSFQGTEAVASRAARHYNSTFLASEKSTGKFGTEMWTGSSSRIGRRFVIVHQCCIFFDICVLIQ